MSTVTCPGCGKRGKFPPHFVGKPIKCRVCGSRFTAAADADDPTEMPATSPRPPAFDLQTEPPPVRKGSTAPVPPSMPEIEAPKLVEPAAWQAIPPPVRKKPPETPSAALPPPIPLAEEKPRVEAKPPVRKAPETPAGQQEEVLEPLILEEPAADQPADCGINLAQPADRGIDLEKKPVIGNQTFKTYLSAINAYMAAKGVQPEESSELIPIDDPAPPPGRTRKLIGAFLLTCVAMASGAVLAAVFWPRPTPLAETVVASAPKQELKAEPIFVFVERPTEEAKPKQAEQMTPEELFAKASPAVVRVVARNANSYSLGSGFLVSPDGLVATNYHVIDKARSATVYFSSGSKVSVLGGLRWMPTGIWLF